MTKISFRLATLEDLPTLQYWDTQAHVLASDPDTDWEWELELPKEVEWREQWVAELDGKPMGFLQIIDPQQEETHYWGKVSPNWRAIDIWIGEAENLNKGYGTQMMHWAFDRCFANPKVKGILIDPLKRNVSAHRFYKRLGFKFKEERIFGEDECYVFELKRSDWESLQLQEK